MLKYPISTLLYLAKINIKDTIQDALKLHNNIDVKLTITVKDKDGKIIKVHKQKSHSFVANFLIMIASLLSDNGYKFTNTSGSTNSFNFNGAISETMPIYNILIGTGTSSPKANDYNLSQPIANGTGSGQMEYGSVSFIQPTVINTNTTTFQISQTYQNSSGSTITVSEVGMEIDAYNISDSTYVLISHDLLSSPISVPNNGVLLVTYTISITT